MLCVLPGLLTWDGSSSPLLGLNCFPAGRKSSRSIPCFGLGLRYSLLHTHTHTHTHKSIWTTKRKNELIDADRALSSDPWKEYLSLSAAPPSISFAFPSPYFRQGNLAKSACVAYRSDPSTMHACMLLLWTSTA